MSGQRLRARRDDVVAMLVTAGWRSKYPGCYVKGDALWASIGGCGDSGLDGGEVAGRWTVQFGCAVPAEVIVAACEAAMDV